MAIRTNTYIPGMENLNRIYSGATQSSTPELPTFGGGSSSNMIGVLGEGSGGGNNVKTISQKDIGTFSAPSYKLPDYSQMGDAPTFNAPSGYSPGAYNAPQYSEAKVRSLTQEQASAGVRGLRSAVQRAMSQNYDNPNVKRMTLRDALAGYGQGLANVMGSAADKARSLYNTQYGFQADAAKTSYQTQAQAGMQNAQLAADAAKTNFEAEFKKYGMKWEDLSNKAQQEYQGRLQSAMANFQSKSDIAKFNASAQNTMTQAKMNMDLQKQLAEYNAAVEDYMNQREGKYKDGEDGGLSRLGATETINNKGQTVPGSLYF